MADVAAALGVAKGTVYLYVESKEALFDLVARYADAARPFERKPPLPVRTPKPGPRINTVRERHDQRQLPPTLAKALSRQRVDDVRAELEAIVGELYDTLASKRRGIKLLDRCARDYPELAGLWFEGARGGLISALTQYLEDRTRRRAFRAFPDPTVAARLIIETVVFWALHRPWDRHPQTVDESLAKETVGRFLVRAPPKEG